MHDKIKEIERKLIPRWRSLSNTPREELKSAAIKTIMPINTESEINEVVRTFNLDPKQHHAIEVLQLRNLTNDLEILRGAAEFVLKQKNISNSVKSQAFDIVNGNVNYSSKSDLSEGEIGVSSLREVVRQNPSNAVANVELARAYVTVGQVRKAEKHFHIALRYAPTNRYVLRAAGRFFVHTKKQDFAWRIMKDAAKYDPWIAAASISIADMANMPMPRSRDILAFIEGIDDPNQTSELSAALATAELESGNNKKAKKLFRQSALSPTDNVIAQLEWASTAHGISFDEKLLNIDLAFEARVARHSRSKEWSVVLENCQNWHADEPFSIRPAYEGGFVASEFLLDFERAILFAEKGLKANPTDAGLLNNIAFFHAMLEKYEAAWKFVAAARKSAPEVTVSITLDATEGMLHYRMGHHEVGQKMYEKAVLGANSIEAHGLKHLALLHFLLEELRIGSRFSQEEIKKIEYIYNSKKVSPQIREIYKIQLEQKLIENKKQNGVDINRQIVDSIKSFDVSNNE